MNAPRRKSVAVAFLLLVVCLVCHSSLKAQPPAPQALAVVSGIISDSEGHPLAGVEVRLSESEASKGSIVTTDGQGRFHFDTVVGGSYTLRANRDGFQQANEGPFLIRAGDAKSFALHLSKTSPGASNSDASATIPFSDEPHFTVAGVTDTTSLGVHASSRTMPNSNALARDTLALSHGGVSEPPSSREADLRARLAAGDDADLRFQLAEIEEKEDHALEAEKDYQRAADLAPTEPHLFAWGAELLLHRAFEPAIEVFRKGNRLYPGSARMLLGLGATYYAQGSREEAAQYFLRASDLDPSNPEPYLFLGRLLSTESVVLPRWVDAMKRFAVQHPKNAAAHYLYGFVLVKQGHSAIVNEAENQLNRAIELDPQFGDAYLQLGILTSNRKDYRGAVVALQKAVEYTPFPDEAHYRLAELYRRMGDTQKARQETALYKQISEQKSRQADRERRDLQQFIYTLGDSTTTPTQSATPKSN